MLSCGLLAELEVEDNPPSAPPAGSFFIFLRMENYQVPPLLAVVHFQPLSNREQQTTEG